MASSSSFDQNADNGKEKASTREGDSGPSNVEIPEVAPSGIANLDTNFSAHEIRNQYRGGKVGTCVKPLDLVWHPRKDSLPESKIGDNRAVIVLQRLIGNNPDKATDWAGYRARRAQPDTPKVHTDLEVKGITYRTLVYQFGNFYGILWPGTYRFSVTVRRHGEEIVQGEPLDMLWFQTYTEPFTITK
jgi:hypothetical protein